jgi:O-antigen/teichoic acid export membrane protein
VTSISVARYDAAIVTVKARLDAALLIGVGLLVAFPIAFASGAAFQLLAFRGYVITDQRLSSFTAILIVIAVLGSSVYQVFFSWELRGRQYRVLGRTRVAQGVVQAGWQIVLGVATRSTLGLLMGDAVGRTSGISVLARRFGRRRFAWLARQPISRLTQIARAHIDCPRVLVPSILVNTFSLQVPTLLILGMYGAKTAGEFAVAQRVVGLPMRLLGATFAQTYFTELSHRSRTNPSGLAPFFRRGLIWLSVGSLAIVFVTSVTPELLYVRIFGAGWENVREIARWVAVAAAAQFVGSPLAQTLIALNAQRAMLAWDVVRLTIVLGAFRGAFLFGLDGVSAIAAYAIGAAIAYVVLIVICYLRIRAASEIAVDPVVVVE